ncbi:extracellular solute-binding protein [Vallitalea pronyensis]|uniref:Extracellular solute-binding protein n=1 Tax=Vallitalea pronyensis TaxID=1348613 RepID=A0A8J8MLA2_9FIRM|nr:extracellular solute-binding protein [Vallitalea pronyensis]QUI23586.1 extracellular solute-binding protein [Vallitalea pronyensis]
MKKVLALVLAGVLMVGIVGCTTKKETKEQEDNGDKVTAEEGTVVIWAWDQNLPPIDLAVKKYEEANPDSNVTFDVQSVPDTVDKLSVFFSSGVKTDLPDLVLVDNLQIQSFLQQYPGKITNISAMGYDKHKQNFSAAHWDILSTDGSLYAFPFDIAPVMMQVNLDVVEAAGVDPDSLNTWNDVIAAAPAIKNAGYHVTSAFAEGSLIGMMQSAGIGIYDKEGHIDLLNPIAVEVIEKFMEMTQAGVQDPLVSGDAYNTGELAISLDPAWLIGEKMPIVPELSGKIKLYPIPAVADNYGQSYNDGGSSFILLETSKLKEAAYAMAEILTTDLEVQDVALAQGLMPGYIPAAELESFQTGLDYYNGQPVWQMLAESASDTLPIYVNKDYQVGKDALKNMVIDVINSGTNKSAIDILKEAATQIEMQTGRKVNQY